MVTRTQRLTGWTMLFAQMTTNNCSGEDSLEKWLKSPMTDLFCGSSSYDYIYFRAGEGFTGSTGKLNMVLLEVQGHGLLHKWNNNARPVWMFRFEGSGNAVLFVLSEHCVSSWFSMLVEEWGLQRPPLLKVFHRGESSDAHGIQGVCRFCLWRRWNTVLCFTTIRLID